MGHKKALQLGVSPMPQMGNRCFKKLNAVSKYIWLASAKQSEELKFNVENQRFFLLMWRVAVGSLILV